MTATELRDWLYRRYGMNKWPEDLDVDHETYANICQYIFDKKVSNPNSALVVHLGKRNGIMFKNVELLIKRES